MGSCFSKEQPKSPFADIDIDNLKQRIDELENNTNRGDLEARLESLESKADLNGDGTVSRQEMETYMATQLKLREDELIRLNQENEALKDALEKAHERYEVLLDKVRSGDTACIQSSKVSSAAIDDQIQKWLTILTLILDGYQIGLKDLPTKRCSVPCWVGWRNSLKVLL